MKRYAAAQITTTAQEEDETTDRQEAAEASESGGHGVRNSNFSDGNVRGVSRFVMPQAPFVEETNQFAIIIGIVFMQFVQQIDANPGIFFVRYVQFFTNAHKCASHVSFFFPVISAFSLLEFLTKAVSSKISAPSDVTFIETDRSLDF
jgi:hypothetical protein